jgi:hypothetical protein
MGLSARTPSAADTAGFVPEVWSNLVLDAVHNQLVCWNAIDGRWTVGQKQGDTINIGIINTVTATEVVVGTKASSLDIATGSKKQLVMNQWYEAPVDIDTMTIAQSQIDWQSQAQKEGAYAIAKNMDTYIASLFASLAGSSVAGSDGNTVDDELLLSLKQYLDENDVPMDSDRSLIIDPSALVDMLKIDKFIQAQYVTMGAVANGKIGTSPIYGCNVLVTNNLAAATTGAYAAMLHRRAIAGAAQMMDSYVLPYPDLHQVRYSTDVLFGASEVRDTFGKSFYTRSK